MMTKHTTAFALLAALGLVACSSKETAPPAPPKPACSAEGSAYRLRDFVLTATKGANGELAALSVAHDAEPGRTLFASKGGAAWASVGKNQLTATERKGSFQVTEKVDPRCEGLTLASAACEGERLVLRGAAQGCDVSYELAFVEAGGRLDFSLELSDPTYSHVELRYETSPAERFLGFGEQYTYLDLKGQRVEMLTQEQGLGRGDATITPVVAIGSPGSEGSPLTTYAPIPHYVTSERRSLFLRNTEYAVFDLTKPDEVRLSVASGAVAGGIVQGATPLELLERHTAATGRMPALPTWMQRGAIVGMQGGTAKVRRIAAELASRSTPLAGFWLQDWVGARATTFGSQLWWNWELDEERYPEWSALRAELEAKGARVLGYVNPFLVDVASKPNAKRNLYKEALDKGYLVRDDKGELVTITLTDFPAAMVDLTNAEARAWLSDVLRGALSDVGLSGWMADFGESLPFEAKLASGETGARYHNRYPVEWAALNREVVRAAGREGDAVFFTRAGGAGSAKASTLFWLGDQNVWWDEFDGLASAVLGLMTGGISGITLNHWDIGGYTTFAELGLKRSKELLFRWMEISAFTPVFRTHEGNRPTENAQFYDDAESLDFFARFAKVYAALEPYRKTLVAEAAERGYPVVRHPWLVDASDVASLDLAPTQREFLLGNDVLVAPIVEPGVTARDVYLPKGRWVHLFRGGAPVGDAAAASRTTVDAPLGTPAVFVREAAAPAIRAALTAAGVAL